MQVKFEIIASGSYEDALKAGEYWAEKYAKGASDISIKATRLKKPNHWKVTLKYQRSA